MWTTWHLLMESHPILLLPIFIPNHYSRREHFYLFRRPHFNTQLPLARSSQGLTRFQLTQRSIVSSFQSDNMNMIPLPRYVDLFLSPPQSNYWLQGMSPCPCNLCYRTKDYRRNPSPSTNLHFMKKLFFTSVRYPLVSALFHSPFDGRTTDPEGPWITGSAEKPFPLSEASGLIGRSVFSQSRRSNHTAIPLSPAYYSSTLAQTE